jgi:hypothetical protein
VKPPALMSVKVVTSSPKDWSEAIVLFASAPAVGGSSKSTKSGLVNTTALPGVAA